MDRWIDVHVHVNTYVYVHCVYVTNICLKNHQCLFKVYDTIVLLGIWDHDIRNSWGPYSRGL